MWVKVRTVSCSPRGARDSRGGSSLFLLLFLSRFSREEQEDSRGLPVLITRRFEARRLKQLDTASGHFQNALNVSRNAPTPTQPVN